MTIRRLHRLNAYAFALFLVAHLMNHLIGLLGVEHHIAFMDAIRQIYRLQLIEIALFLLFGMQIILGLKLIFQRGKPKGRWAWSQVISGFYIAFFLLQHLFAVAMMRLAYPALDTNFYWASAVAQAKPMGWYFLPYYGFALLAVFTHIAAAIHFKNPKRRITKSALIGCGVLMALAVPAALAGSLFAVNLPAEILTYMSEFYPSWLTTNL